MSNYLLANDQGKVFTYNGHGLINSDRVPYIDIKCPSGFDPESEGCGKSYGHWEIVDRSQNIWRYTCKFANWRNLFYDNRTRNAGDFQHGDGDFECVGAGNTDLVTGMAGLFRNCTGLTSCATIDTHNCIDLSAMFAECEYLLEVPYLDTAYNRDFNNFVVNCHRLVKVNQDINTSNGRSYWWFAYGCESLTELPVIDLTNADDSYQNPYARRGGCDHMFTFCESLEYVHIIGGSNISNFCGMFILTGSGAQHSAKNLVIDWEDCYLPLVTGDETDPDGGYAYGMFDDYGNTGMARYKSISSFSMPYLRHNVDKYFPAADKYGNVTMPRVNEISGLRFPITCTEVGSIDFSNATMNYGQLFMGCTQLKQFPDVQFPTSGSYDFTSTFYDMTSVGAGAYAMYQKLVPIASSYSRCFHNTGINTSEGQQDLAQIPQSWKYA